MKRFKILRWHDKTSKRQKYNNFVIETQKKKRICGFIRIDKWRPLKEKKTKKCAELAKRKHITDTLWTDRCIRISFRWQISTDAHRIFLENTTTYRRTPNESSNWANQLAGYGWKKRIYNKNSILLKFVWYSK